MVEMKICYSFYSQSSQARLYKYFMRSERKGTKGACLLPLWYLYFYCSTGQKCCFLIPNCGCKTGPFMLTHGLCHLWDAGTDFSLLDSKEYME